MEVFKEAMVGLGWRRRERMRERKVACSEIFGDWSSSYCRLAGGMEVRHPVWRRPEALSLRFPYAA